MSQLNIAPDYYDAVMNGDFVFKKKFDFPRSDSVICFVC